MRGIVAPAVWNSKGTRLLILATLAAFGASLSSCGGSKPSSGSSEIPAAVSPYAKGPQGQAHVPEEFQSVADSALGRGAIVAASGDLAGTGNQQVLAVNLLLPGSDGVLQDTGLTVTRAVIEAKQPGGWTEVLRCDENLKNPNGYLGRASKVTASSWNLKAAKAAGAASTTFYFTPIGTPQGTAGGNGTIAVKWNPAKKEYQSVDAKTGKFQHDSDSADAPSVTLRP